MSVLSPCNWSPLSDPALWSSPPDPRLVTSNGTFMSSIPNSLTQPQATALHQSHLHLQTPFIQDQYYTLVVHRVWMAPTTAAAAVNKKNAFKPTAAMVERCAVSLGKTECCWSGCCFGSRRKNWPVERFEKATKQLNQASKNKRKN